MKTKEFRIFYLNVFQIEGLSKSQQILLGYIYSRQQIGTPKGQGALADKLGRRQENVSVNLRKLVDKGLIGYVEDRIYPTWHAEELINPELEKKPELKKKEGRNEEEFQKLKELLGV